MMRKEACTIMDLSLKTLKHLICTFIPLWQHWSSVAPITTIPTYQPLLSSIRSFYSASSNRLPRLQCYHSCFLLLPTDKVCVGIDSSAVHFPPLSNGNTYSKTLSQDAYAMLYHQPTHYCCCPPSSSTVRAQNRQKLQVAMVTKRTQIDIHQQETTTPHSSHIVISPMYAVFFVVERL